MPWRVICSSRFRAFGIDTSRNRSRRHGFVPFASAAFTSGTAAGTKIGRLRGPLTSRGGRVPEEGEVIVVAVMAIIHIANLPTLRLHPATTEANPNVAVCALNSENSISLAINSRATGIPHAPSLESLTLVAVSMCPLKPTHGRGLSSTSFCIFEEMVSAAHFARFRGRPGMRTVSAMSPCGVLRRYRIAHRMLFYFQSQGDCAAGARTCRRCDVLPSLTYSSRGFRACHWKQDCGNEWAASRLCPVHVWLGSSGLATSFRGQLSQLYPFFAARWKLASSEKPYSAVPAFSAAFAGYLTRSRSYGVFNRHLHVFQSAVHSFSLWGHCAQINTHSLHSIVEKPFVAFTPKDMNKKKGIY